MKYGLWKNLLEFIIPKDENKEGFLKRYIDAHPNLDTKTTEEIQHCFWYFMQELKEKDETPVRISDKV